MHTRRWFAVAALGVAALALLPGGAGQARAGNVTISLSWSGGSTGPIDFTSLLAQSGSTANSLTVDTAALNFLMSNTGSNMGFLSLSAFSNNPGDPAGASFKEMGIPFLTGVGGDSSVTIVASQAGFTSPAGKGTLSSSASASFLMAAPGSPQASNSFLDATGTPTITLASSSSDPNSESDSNSLSGVTGAVTGYTLGASAFISLSGSPTSASDAFSIDTEFAVTVPEPASLTLLGVVALGLLGYGRTRKRRTR
jgi:hypothetical protein